MKSPIEVLLPCCVKTYYQGTRKVEELVVVNVTHRKSKMAERPRNHTCSQCGTKYEIGGNYKPVKV